MRGCDAVSIHYQARDIPRRPSRLNSLVQRLFPRDVWPENPRVKIRRQAAGSFRNLGVCTLSRTVEKERM